MKTSVVFATGIVCCLAGGMSAYAGSGDLESALENINISTDSQNIVKNHDNTNEAPCSKSTETNCPNSHDDDVKTNTYQATALQQTILNGTMNNVTVNGAPAVGGNTANVSISGF